MQLQEMEHIQIPFIRLCNVGMCAALNETSVIILLYVLGRSSDDQGRDGQEVRSVVACSRGRGLRLRDLLRVQESPLYVFWG